MVSEIFMNLALSFQAKFAAVIANLNWAWPNARSDVVVRIQAAIR